MTRDDQVIRAMQRRFNRNLIASLLWRKPWRSTTRPTGLADFIGWLRLAHDCSDPAVGCSCYPSFRFPLINGDCDA